MTTFSPEESAPVLAAGLAPQSAIPDDSIRPSRLTFWLLLTFAALPCLAAFFLNAPSSDAPALTVTRQRPALLFLPYMSHHGEEPVEPSATVTSEFRFRNDGEFPVTIQRIERSCGCMNSQLSKKLLAPGDMGSLIVPLQTVSQSPGYHEYTLTVHYTDPKPQQATLTIKATFPKKMVVVQPKELFLSQASDRMLPFRVAVTDYRDEPLRVKDVISTASFVHTDIHRKSVAEIVQASHSDEAAPGFTTEIRGEVEGGIPPGRHHVLIAAETDDSEFPVITVPMRVNGPAYAPGHAATLNSSAVQLLASDHSSARRRATVLMTAPEHWTISHASAWPEELAVRYEAAGQPTGGEQITRITIELTELPKSRTRDGLVQLVANDGKDLVTVRVSLVWP
ncbi:MAG: DUF1573 domain-containing protein [Planctomycetaceae bacterium]